MQLNVIIAVAKLLQVAALLFFLIALGSSYWTSATGVHGGLWELCIGGNCEDIDSDCKAGSLFKLPDCDAFNAVRAFNFLGMLFAAVTCILGFFFIFKGTASMKVVVPITAAIAGVCGVIAMAVFVGRICAYHFASCNDLFMLTLE